MIQKLDDYFEISKRGSTFGREIRGGVVSFIAMAYIVVLNPVILSGTDSTGAALDPNQAGRVAAVTALVAGVMSILMGAVSKFPLCLAAGLGINSLVAVSATTLKGATWQDIMGLIVAEGILMLILVISGFRKAVFDAIPKYMRSAISVGIGLFICLIGLCDGGFVTPGSGTPVQIGVGGSIASIPVLIFALTLILLAVLWVKKVPGAIIISVIVSAVVSFIVEAALHLGPSATNPDGGWKSSVPAFSSNLFHLPDFSLLGQFNILGAFTNLGPLVALMLCLSFLLSDFFDTMGTMVAVAKQADLIGEDGNPINTKRILIVDAIAAISGGAGSVSSNTAFVESSAGVADGARTGLSAITTGVLFLLAIFVSPLTVSIPSEAVTPVLVFVGILMFMGVSEIDWTDATVAIPAFAMIAMMPFAYSITAGIGVGFILHVIIKAATGKIKEVHPLLLICAVLFVVYFAQTPIQALLR